MLTLLTNLFVESMLFLNNKSTVNTPRELCNGTEQHSKKEECYRLSYLKLQEQLITILQHKTCTCMLTLLSPNSDQHQFSPNNIHTMSGD